jgi:hypothetical protein
MNIRKNTSEVYAELNRIAEANHGALTPEAVLKNAQSKTSPIHDYFTWNDTEAACKLRLLEASMLIRSVKVSVEMHDQDEPLHARAFVNVASNEREDDGKAKSGFYVPLNVALKVPDYREQMLENAARELSSFKHKYAILAELSEVFDAASHFQQRFNLQAA